MEKSIEERLNALENVQAPKRSGTAATSIIAVVISLMSAGFTLYDRIVVAPRSALATQYDQFSQTLDDINALNATYPERLARAQSDEEKSAISSATSQQILLRLTTAERLLHGVEDRPNAQQYLALAQMNFNTYDYRDSLKYIDAAEREGPTSLEQSLLLRTRMQIVMQMEGDSAINRGRQLLDQADAVIRDETVWGSSFHKAEVQMNRFMLEGLFGDCARLPETFNKFRMIASARDISPEVQGGYRQRIRQFAASVGARCAMPQEVVAFVASAPAMPTTPAAPQAVASP